MDALVVIVGAQRAVPLQADVDAFRRAITDQQATRDDCMGTARHGTGTARRAPVVSHLAPLADRSRDLIKQIDMLYKLASSEVDAAITTGKRDDGRDALKPSELRKHLRELDGLRATVVEQLRLVRYFWKQAHWLTERFPEAKLRDVPGLVKLVDRAEIEANDWSLTPGRYVGVAPEEEDEDFNFEETLREIHVELEDLNAEAVQLAAVIKKNFEEMGV